MIRDDDDGVDEQLNREGRKFNELKGGQVALLKQINKFVIAKIDFFLIQSKVSFVFFLFMLYATVLADALNLLTALN